MRGHLNPCYLLGIPHDLGNPQMAGNLGIDAQVTSHESSLGWRFGWALGAILGVSSKGKWISMAVSGSGCVLSFLVGRFSTINSHQPQNSHSCFRSVLPWQDGDVTCFSKIQVRGLPLILVGFI